jgi:hypothetical protein
MPMSFQFIFQFLKIINLAVEDHLDLSVLIRQGLMASRKIDNAQTAMAQKNRRALRVERAKVFSGIIWATMDQGVTHPDQDFMRWNVIRCSGQESKDAAHKDSGDHFLDLVCRFPLRFVIRSGQDLGQKAHQDGKRPQYHKEHA